MLSFKHSVYAKTIAFSVPGIPLIIIKQIIIWNLGCYRRRGIQHITDKPAIGTYDGLISKMPNNSYAKVFLAHQ